MYRAVALGTIDEHRDIRNQIQGLHSVLSVQKEQVMRRASGLNQLFEYLVNKELDVTPAASAAAAAASAAITSLQVTAPILGQKESLPKIKSSRTAKGKEKAGKKASRREVAAAVRQIAVAEVKRFHNMPSLKWTYGVDMDPSEIRHLRRSIDTGHMLPHSGYDKSLTHGTETRSTSPGDQRVEDGGYFSDISDLAQRPPSDIDPKEVPLFFYRKHRRHPGRYVVSLHDYSDKDMDKTFSDPHPALPQNVPQPPKQPHNHSESHHSVNIIIFIY